MDDSNIVRLVPSALDELDQLAERPSSIKRLRDHHHLIARFVAEGKRTTDIAREVGISVSRVSILKGDPAFKELVEKYRMNIEQMRDLAFADYQKQVALLFGLSVNELTERMEEDPSQFTHDMLLRMAEFAGDRSGFIKSSRNISINTSFDGKYLAERDDAGRRLADQLSAPKIGAGGAGTVIEQLPSPTPKGEDDAGGAA